MRRIVASSVIAAFLLATFVTRCDADGARGDGNAAPASEAGGIVVTKSAASWDNLADLFLGSTPAAPFGEGSVFVMRGELRNDRNRAVRYVVLRYELLDKDGNVLQDVEGYNRSAEAMRADEEGAVHADQVKPIPAGGTDSYRMVFFHDEVPRFVSQRVRVVEVHDDEPAGGAAPAEAPGVVEPKK